MHETVVDRPGASAALVQQVTEEDVHPRPDDVVTSKQLDSQGPRDLVVEDLYLVITSIDPDGDIVLRAFVNPLTWWIWMGTAVMAIGMSVILSGGTPEAALSPAGSRVRKPVVATR